MKRIYYILLLCSLTTVLLISCDSKSQPSEPYAAGLPDEDIVCTIKQSADTISLDEPLNIEIKFENKTNEDVYLTYILDGSWWQFRYPYCYFEIISEAGDTIEAGGRMCGVTNPLDVSNFKLVKAGETFIQSQSGSILGFYRINITTPGKYSFRYCYDTRSKDFDAWSPFAPEKSTDIDEMKRLIGLVPKKLIKSNKIDIVITE